MFCTHTAAKSWEQDLFSLLPSRSDVLPAPAPLEVIAPASGLELQNRFCCMLNVADFRQLTFWRLQLHGQNWQPIYHSRFAQNSTTAHKLKPRDCHEDLRKQQTDCKPVILHTPAQALSNATSKLLASRVRSSATPEQVDGKKRNSLTFPLPYSFTCRISKRCALSLHSLSMSWMCGTKQIAATGASTLSKTWLPIKSLSDAQTRAYKYSTLHCKAWPKDLAGITDCLLLLCGHPLRVHTEAALPLIQRWSSAISQHVHHPSFPQGQAHEAPTPELCLMDNQR